jgi:hypothetical protein
MKESIGRVKWLSHVVMSRGGVTHVGVYREGFKWWCHMVESRGGVT